MIDNFTLSTGISQQLIEAMKSPAVVVDDSGKVIIANNLFDNSEFRKEFQSALKKSLSKPKASSPDIIQTESRWISVSQIELEFTKKYFLVLFKISEHADFNSRLKNLSHDLNNILTAILNSALLVKNHLNSEAVGKLISSIEVNALRAASILESALNKDEKLNVSNVEINLSILLKELSESLKYFSNKNIEFDINDKNQSYWIMGNYDGIYRALQNILINAIEAIKKNGKIKIAFNSVPQFVCVKITDNGIGIKNSETGRIFEKNYSTKIRKRESGLGLNIVKEIIEQHSGYIEVDSVYGSGTEFRVFLPVYLHAQQQNKINGSRKKIIIADDEENILQTLQELLTSLNYMVFPARNGKEVLNILDKEKIEIILIDRKMPELDGLECIQKINKRNYTGKIILTTGSPGVKFDEEMMKELRIFRLLMKPYDFNSLLEII